MLDEKNHCIESEITENIAFQKEKNIFSQAQESTWCHGAAGFLMARMAMCEADPECRKLEMVRFSLEKHVEQVFRGNERMGNCLCHGWCGNWFIANLYIMKYGGSLLQKKELYLLQQVIIKRLGKMSAYETYHPGLMTGVTGIGLTCLLIHYQDFLSNSNLMPFRDK